MGLTLRIAEIIEESVTDGPGIRLAVFVQGCRRGCAGCHNPEAQDPMAGREADPAEITAKALRNPLVEGLTITGGEPFEQPEEAGALAASAKAAGLSVITYTGYLWEELLPRLETGKLLKNSDYIVDGPYMEPQRSLALDFRGSRNQRVIDVKASLAAGKVVLAGETWGAPIGAELRNGRG